MVLHRHFVGLTAALGFIAWACSGTDSSSPDETAGGSGIGGALTSSGGAQTLGGTTSTLGTLGGAGGSTPPVTGGTPSLGGALSSGGAHVTGGVQATLTGGTKSTGGTLSLGGSLATGGTPSGGGTQSALGGASSTGGMKPTGGASNTGGSKATGGSSSTGGTKATGGASTNGGSPGTSCLANPVAQLGTAAPGGTITTDYGFVAIAASSSRQIVRLQTTLLVPPKPPASGTLFLWPGLQPGGANFLPIDNGVLQPVLTWGPSCAPGTQPRAYSTWWISGQYVNTNGSQPGYTDCNGGPIMSVNVCDPLIIDMALSGTVWTQTVTDAQTNQIVTYSIDMKSQAQNYAYFVIEEYSSAPVSEVVFTDTTITFGSADAADCRLNHRGQNDYVSAPQASSDGRQCSIQQIILRAQGIK